MVTRKSKIHVDQNIPMKCKKYIGHFKKKLEIVKPSLKKYN